MFPACNLNLMFKRNRNNEPVLLGFLTRICQLCKLAEANILVSAMVEDKWLEDKQQ